jgi:hypothetical protein
MLVLFLEDRGPRVSEWNEQWWKCIKITATIVKTQRRIEKGKKYNTLRILSNKYQRICPNIKNRDERIDESRWNLTNINE